MGDGGQKPSSLEMRVKLNSPLFIPWRFLGESWNIIGLILTLSTRCNWVVNLMPWPYNPPRKNPWCTWSRLCEPQSRSGHVGEEQLLLLLLWMKPWIIQPIVQSMCRQVSWQPLSHKTWIHMVEVVFIVSWPNTATVILLHCVLYVVGWWFEELDI